MTGPFGLVTGVGTGPSSGAWAGPVGLSNVPPPERKENAEVVRIANDMAEYGPFVYR
jgi:hypothetical protein